MADANQADLYLAKSPGCTVLPAHQLCWWAKMLVVITAWVLRYEFCHNPCADCCVSLPPLSQSNFQWSSPTDSPASIVGQIRAVAPTKGMGGGLLAVPQFSSPMGGIRGSREASPMEQCDQWMCSCFSLLMPSVLVSVVQGVLQPHLCVIRFSQIVSCPQIIVSCSSREGEQNQEWS